MDFLRLLLCASWLVTSHTLRLRYGEALMRKADAFQLDENTPEEIKFLSDPVQQMEDHRKRVCIVERCISEDSPETRSTRRTSKQVLVNLETTHITVASGELEELMSVEKTHLDESVKDCSYSYAGHTKWKIIGLMGNKVKIKKIGGEPSKAYKTKYDEKVLCELYKLVKNLEKSSQKLL